MSFDQMVVNLLHENGHLRASPFRLQSIISLMYCYICIFDYKTLPFAFQLPAPLRTVDPVIIKNAIACSAGR